MPKVPNRIYVVDDNASVREASEGLIRSAGLHVESFSSAEDAWSRAQVDPPDCMILDVHMPDLNGLDLQDRLAEVGLKFPIIFMTGEGDIPMSVRAMKGGAQEFLTKPFKNSALLSAVADALAGELTRRQTSEDDLSHSADMEVLRLAGAANGLLLQDMLPVGIADELKQNGFVEPVFFPDAAVIFTDFEHFTESASLLSPSEVVALLHMYFTEFDAIVARHGLEKIKTIGDSYMAVAGVPTPHQSPYRAACDAALDIVAASRRISGANGWAIRIGIHAGPLVAGVIGKHKYSYDVWGSTVNMASRMESSGIPGKINVSADLRARVEPHYDWEYRGVNPVKGLGSAEMYILLGKNGTSAAIVDPTSAATS